MSGEMRLIEDGLRTAFIDSGFGSSTDYRAQFISNDYKNGKKVISSIEKELMKCDEFIISVAFITMSGIVPLLQIFKELEKRNVHGKILTTDYLTFCEPGELDKIACLSNVELKMYCTDGNKEGFHTKGYIFKSGQYYRVITGSSNMTLNALTINKEWNTKIVSTKDGEYVKDILSEFSSLWHSDLAKLYDDFIEEYRLKYKVSCEQKKIAKNKAITSLESYNLKPNSMQVQMIANLKKIVDEGSDRGLLISATGERDIFMTSERNLEIIRGSVA